MKKAKKLVSLLLAVVMLLSLSVSVGAAAGGGTEQPVVTKPIKNYTKPLNDSDTTCGKPTDTSYRGTINVNNAKYGETYSLYQILYLKLGEILCLMQKTVKIINTSRLKIILTAQIAFQTMYLGIYLALLMVQPLLLILHKRLCDMLKKRVNMHQDLVNL